MNEAELFWRSDFGPHDECVNSGQDRVNLIGVRILIFVFLSGHAYESLLLSQVIQLNIIIFLPEFVETEQF